MMNKAFAASLVLALAVVFSPGTQASDCGGDACPVAVSTFKVPNLNREMTKQLVKELAKVPGILSAKPAAVSSSLAVTFETSRTSAEKIGAVLKPLAPGVELAGTAPGKAPAAHPECATCPSRAGCGRGK